MTEMLGGCLMTPVLCLAAINGLDSFRDAVQSSRIGVRMRVLYGESSCLATSLVFFCMTNQIFVMTSPIALLYFVSKYIQRSLMLSTLSHRQATD